MRQWMIDIIFARNVSHERCYIGIANEPNMLSGVTLEKVESDKEVIEEENSKVTRGFD